MGLTFGCKISQSPENEFGLKKKGKLFGIVEKENRKFIKGKQGWKKRISDASRYGTSLSKKMLCRFTNVFTLEPRPDFFFSLRFAVKMCFLPVVCSISMKLTHQQFPKNRPK